jgi:hypothetical protein
MELQSNEEKVLVSSPLALRADLFVQFYIHSLTERREKRAGG